MKVLLAVDGSESSRAPVMEAASRIWPAGTHIRVLSVVEWEPIPAFIPGGMPLPPSPESEEARERVAIRAAQEAASIVRQNSGVTLDVKVLHGNARAAIVDEAKSWPADLILMGSHGRTGIKRFLLGSVAQGVLAHAPCSVEVVRDRQADSFEPAPI